MTEKEKSEEIISFIANAKKQTPCELITDENICNTCLLYTSDAADE